MDRAAHAREPTEVADGGNGWEVQRSGQRSVTMHQHHASVVQRRALMELDGGRSVDWNKYLTLTPRRRLFATATELVELT